LATFFYSISPIVSPDTSKGGGPSALSPALPPVLKPLKRFSPQPKGGDHGTMPPPLNTPLLTFHPRCCLPGPAASGSGVGKKPLRSPRSGDQGERGPRLPARYGSVPINDVRSNAAGSLSSLIFVKHGFQMYLQINNTTTAYLQCCRLPMLQAYNHAACSLCCSRLPNKWRYRTRLPMLLDYNNATCSLCCSRLPNKWRYRTRLPMLLDYNNATCSLCCTSSSMLQTANMWRYRTASGSQRQCCCLASGSLYAAPMLPSLALCCRLPTVAIPHCKWLPTMLHEAPSMLRLPSTACRKTACRELPAE
jgi:hypothetical protein